MSLEEQIARLVKGKKNVIGWSSELVPKQKRGRFLKTKRSIRVYVTRKEDVDDLSKKDLIPDVLKIGNEEIDVDVVVVGEIKSLGVRDVNRPICGGISAMAHYSGATACTLGYFGKSTKEGEKGLVGIVPNNHCGCNENILPIGTPYTQPSKYDGGKLPDHQVAVLKRFVKLKFNEFTCPYRNFLHKIVRFFTGEKRNRCDNAFEAPIDVEYLKLLYGIGEIRYKREARIGDKVKKCGRTTGITTGATVIDEHAVMQVQYSRGICMFEDVVVMHGKDFSAGGDSSSFVVLENADDTIVTQLFAGSDTNTIGIRLGNIESELEIELLADWTD